MIFLKSSNELDAMDRANRVVHQVLREVRSAARPGVTTSELDVLAEDMI